jgi:hypothetical protein
MKKPQLIKRWGAHIFRLGGHRAGVQCPVRGASRKHRETDFPDRLVELLW